MDYSTVNLMDPDTHTDDPFEFYNWLRDECPLYFDRHNQLWAVSRYEDVIRVARDSETFCSTEGNLPKMPPDASLINLDGRPHSKRRALLSKGFTPRRIATLRTHAQDIVTELIDRIAPLGRCDVVDDLAKPLPMRIIGEMLGYPLEDHGKLLHWIDGMIKGGDGPDYVTEESMQAFLYFQQYHAAMVEARTKEPKDDLLSMWISAEIDGKPLEDVQMLFDHVLILAGGSETTRNAISGGVKLLIEHPDQRQYLIENPDGIPRAIDEIVRFTSPFVRMARTATRDVEMHGKVIKKGQEIIMLYPAATRDPRAYDEPDRFNVRRETDKHLLAFGYGPHFCLGANLARLELQVMFSQLLLRVPDMEFVPEEPPIATRSGFIRGLTSLPVVFTPR